MDDVCCGDNYRGEKNLEVGKGCQSLRADWTFQFYRQERRW